MSFPLKTHLVVRAIIIEGDKILLAKAIGTNNTFLPGGHHEGAESLPNCLEREMVEEIDQEIIIEQFLGVVENAWKDDKRENYELNHIFLAKRKTPEKEAKSIEDHLTFYWAPLEDLEKVNLLPSSMIELARAIHQNQTFSPFWKTSL